VTGISDEDFLVGVNFGWIGNEYEHDFGHNFLSKPYPRKPYYDLPEGKEELAQFFENFKGQDKHNISIIRAWAFEKFEALEFLDLDPVLKKKNSPNTLKITGLDASFKRNIVDLVKFGNCFEIKIYLCLFDAWPIFDTWKEALGPNASDEEIKEYQELQKIWKFVLRGMLDPESNLQEKYFEIVIDFLKHIVNQETFFAIDLFNEPESLWEKGGFTKQQVLDFLKDLSEKIKKVPELKDVKISCGFKSLSTIDENKKNLEFLDFFDYHPYNCGFYLKPYFPVDYLGKDCIIGECGFPQGAAKDDEKENIKVLKSFSEEAVKKGYMGLISWIKGYSNETDLIKETIKFSLKKPKRQLSKKSRFETLVGISKMLLCKLSILFKYRKLI